MRLNRCGNKRLSVMHLQEWGYATLPLLSKRSVISLQAAGNILLFATNVVGVNDLTLPPEMPPF